MTEKRKNPTNDVKGNQWSVLCHLAGFTGFTGFIFPFGNIIVPLVIWLLKRYEYKGVDYNGKEVLNFQLTMSIYYLIGMLLIFVFIGFNLLPILMIFHVVCMIIGAIKTSDGKKYKYPLTIRFIT